MFRNTYLDVYKNSFANTNSRANIQQLIIHFTQIYATLGSVLQDLQFQVGLILYAESNISQKQTQKNQIKTVKQNINQIQQNKKQLFQHSNKLIDNYQLQNKKQQKLSMNNQNHQLNNNYMKSTNQFISNVPDDSQKQIQIQSSSFNNVMSTQQFDALFMNPLPIKQTKINKQKQAKDLQKQRNSSNANRNSNKQIDYLDQILNKGKK